jgi:hypothetical protein
VKYVTGFFALCFAIFLIDLALAHFAEWRKARRRAREMRKYGLASFKPVSRDWWQA